MRNKLSKVLQVIALAIVLVFAAGCDFTRQIQAQTANSIAGAANASLPILLKRYEQEGVDKIKEVKAKGGTADDARAAVEWVKAKWAPIWKAWETLRIAQDTWADALETDGNFVKALVALKDAYCALRKVWPNEIPAVPLAPLKCVEAPQ